MRNDISRLTRWGVALGTLGAACAALAAACGGSSSNDNGHDGGAPGATAEGGAKGDDAGPACGLLAQCSTSQVCCYKTGALLPSCADAGDCNGSVVSCSSKSQCGSQTCCFTFAEEDGGGEAGALSTSFSASCQDSCPSTSYTLCGADSDCAEGQTCFPGLYGSYCASFDGGFAFPDGGFTYDGGFPLRRDAGGAQPDGGAPAPDASVDGG